MIRAFYSSLIILMLGGFAHANPFFHFWKDNKSSSSITGYLKVEALKRTELRNQTIQEILTVRCHRYLFYSNLKNSCRKAIQILIEELDSQNFSIVDETNTKNTPTISFIPVSFSHELKKLVANPRVYSYLLSINSSLPSLYEEFNFWTLTVQHALSFEEAVKWLAILFQDTSPEMIQIQYLKKLPEYKTHKGVNAVVTELEKAIYNLQKENHKSRPQLEHLRSFLPPFKANIHQYSNTGYYHFYVPGYLAMRLKERGISTELSSFIPFLFNYLYEVFTLPSSYSSVLIEPRNIQEEHTIRDVYMGYLGAKFALNPLNETLNFKEFSTLLKHDPKVLIYSIALIK